MIGNVLDVFKTDAFGLNSMIARFDTVEFVPGQALALPIWETDSIDTEVALVERRDEPLIYVNSSPRGAAGQQVSDGKRDIVPIPVPHFQQNATVEAAEVAGVREFGTTNQLQTVESVVMRKLRMAGTRFNAVEELLSIHALQGIVMDPDGVRTLADLYALLGFTKEVEATWTFHITASDAAGAGGDGSLKENCVKMTRKIRDNLRMGSIVPQVYCFMTSGFTDRFTKAKEVRDAYRFYENAGQYQTFLREGQQFGKPPFRYGDILFEEYRGTGIPDNKAIFFPILPAGVQSIYKMIYAPADYIETVNTLGRPRYAKVAPDVKFNKYVEMETQMNPLPICLRPQALITTSFD